MWGKNAWKYRLKKAHYVKSFSQDQVDHNLTCIASSWTCSVWPNTHNSAASGFNKRIIHTQIHSESRWFYMLLLNTGFSPSAATTSSSDREGHVPACSGLSWSALRSYRRLFFLVMEQSQRRPWLCKKRRRRFKKKKPGTEEAAHKSAVFTVLAQLLGRARLNRPRCKQKQMWTRRERLDWNKKKTGLSTPAGLWVSAGPPSKNTGGAGAVGLRTVAGWTQTKRGGASLFLLLLYAFIACEQRGLCRLYGLLVH